jgi:hypothetical protein
MKQEELKSKWPLFIKINDIIGSSPKVTEDEPMQLIVVKKQKQKDHKKKKDCLI